MDAESRAKGKEPTLPSDSRNRKERVSLFKNKKKKPRFTGFRVTWSQSKPCQNASILLQLGCQPPILASSSKVVSTVLARGFNSSFLTSTMSFILASSLDHLLKTATANFNRHQGNGNSGQS